MFPRTEMLPPAAMAAVLAFAGLPLYIHLPRFYAEEMGINLAILGAVLLLARGIDSFQDPIIGFLADRWRKHRKIWTMISGTALAIGILVLFAPPEWGEPLPRLVLGLFIAFSGFSSLQIALYDHGLAQTEKFGGGYTQVSLWREAGGLVGICLAASTPTVLAKYISKSASYTVYSIFLFIFVLFALVVMHRKWIASGQSFPRKRFSDSLGVEGVKPILAFSFVNALPTSVTSTLFLFFVTDLLNAESHAGFLLILFFGAAAIAAIFWARLANHYGRKVVLLAGMALSIPAFIWTWFLGPGDTLAFYVIVVASGATLGADMTLTPAILASRIKGGGGQIFSIWTFLHKSALAIAAGIVLPLLAFSGYEPGSTDQGGLRALAVAYALVPCGLKLIAILVLWKYVNKIGVEG